METPEQIAERAFKRLTGTMKKYTHTIQMKGNPLPAPVVVESDEQLENHHMEGVIGRVLTSGYSGRTFFAHVNDVLYWQSQENVTND